MALPTIVQTTQAATSAAGPASIAPTWAASAAGSVLVAVVAVAASGAPTVSTPAGWLAGNVVTQGTAISIRYFWILPVAGNTGATFNLTNANGAAVAFWELGSMAQGNPVDNTSFRSGQNAGSTAVSVPTNPQTFTRSFMIGAIASISGQAYTPANVNGTLAWTTGPTATSTVGATNVVLTTFTVSQGANPSPLAQIVGTLAGAVAWTAFTVNFLASDSGVNNHGGVDAGQLVSAGAGYAVGI